MPPRAGEGGLGVRCQTGGPRHTPRPACVAHVPRKWRWLLRPPTLPKAQGLPPVLQPHSSALAGCSSGEQRTSPRLFLLLRPDKATSPSARALQASQTTAMEPVHTRRHHAPHGCPHTGACMALPRSPPPPPQPHPEPDLAHFLLPLWAARTGAGVPNPFHLQLLLRGIGGCGGGLSLQH